MQPLYCCVPCTVLVKKLKVFVSRPTPVLKHRQCSYYMEYVFLVKDEVSHFDFAENWYNYSIGYFNL
jgi:hypothetical protein